MTTCNLSLPYDIPWTLIGASADMMDTSRCDSTFPYPWRTSLAMYAFEPAIEDIPVEMCDVRITYLKVSCSITGYQPNASGATSNEYSDVDEDAVEDILAEYYGCYGALLNVAVFPYSDVLQIAGTTTVAFTAKAPRIQIPNPYTESKATFKTPGRDLQEISDVYPKGGDGQGELPLQGECTVTVPATTHVEAKVVHYGQPVTMKAYSRTALLSSQSSGSEQGLIHTLSIDGVNIDKVVLTSSSVEAVLLEFSFATVTEKRVTLKDYPHIVDVEPKTRDLYQSTTQSGEVLTSSNSGLNTGKSFSSLTNSQTDVNFKGDWGDMSHTWGTSNEDSWSVETDATRERREMQSTTTQLSQLYNLLTAYHAGTNRTTFLMLARPHVLQPSDRRTFVQGARIIEGIQDFILIIVRPRSMNGLCFEAALDTGHFPEDVEITEPTEKYDEGHEDFEVTHFVNQGTFKNCEPFSKTHTLETGWIVDRDKGDTGHPGVEEIANNSNPQANDTLTNYSYGVVTDTSVSVSGNVCGSGLVDTGPGPGDASFKRTYRVFKRSAEPTGDTIEGSADVGELFITVRHLCACMKSTDTCPEIVNVPLDIEAHPQDIPWILDEIPVRVSGKFYTASATRQFREAASKEFIRNVKSRLTAARNRPTRFKPGQVRFEDTDTFKNRLIKSMPQEVLGRPLKAIKGLPDKVQRAFPKDATVGDAVGMKLRTLMRKTGLSLQETVQLRQRLLGRRAD